MAFLYVGAYTKAPQGSAGGIGVYRFDDQSGSLDHVQTVERISNPSFVALDADRSHLYAVCEGGEGSVAAFSRDPNSGQLTELNRQESQGSGPCYVSVAASGSHVLVANYGSGSVAALPINDDGSLEAASSVVQQEGSSVNPDRQEGPHAHMIASTPDGRYVLATDLGADQIIAYTLDATSGELVQSATTSSRPGAGPRHFAFSPDGGRVYVINELDSTVTSYSYDASNGTLTPRQTVPTLPEEFGGENTTAHIVASDDGQFVYGSNRGHDSIAIFAVDAESGDLTSLGHVPTEGSTPRNFSIDPTGRWLLAANQQSDTLVAFHRDAQTGQLSDPVASFDLPSAVGLVFCEE